MQVDAYIESGSLGHLPSEFRTSAISFFGNLFSDVGSKEAPFTTLSFFGGRSLLNHSKWVVSIVCNESKRYFFVSMSTRRREIYFEGTPPVVYPQRNILLSRRQRDDEIFFSGYTPCLKLGGVNPQRKVLVVSLPTRQRYISLGVYYWGYTLK